MARQRVSLVAVGDFGVGNDDEAAVAAAMRAWVEDQGTDAFVSVGDSVYPEAEAKYFDAAWTEPFGWVDEAGIPVIAALGNHDLEDGSSAELIEFFKLPGAWFEHKVGNVRIIVLDSNQVESAEQTRWLEATLAEEDPGWTVVVVHKPPYDCGRYEGTPEVRDRWAKMFPGRVDLVLSGHDHNYQRFAPHYGVTYIVTGGGGDSFYGLDDECTAETPARVAGNDTTHHFLALRASDRRLEVIAIGSDGSVIDRFGIRRR
jgi:predicted phosphodiesterase